MVYLINPLLSVELSKTEFNENMLLQYVFSWEIVRTIQNALVQNKLKFCIYYFHLKYNFHLKYKFSILILYLRTMQLNLFAHKK